MPSCLGLYTDKNMVKYAKLTSEKNGEKYSVDAFGVKFYDNIQTTVNEIALEVGMERGPIALALTNEEYYNTQVFSNLKMKDVADLVNSEYEEIGKTRGVPLSVAELRFIVFKNSGVQDKNGIICVTTSKTEIANIGTTYENYKVSSIEPLAVSLKNLFENQGIDEECAVVNIDDRTTVTVFHASEIQYVDNLPLGAGEIINRLASKYNSAAKAYEACKKVSAYLEPNYDTDDAEMRDILDVVVPTLYEIRQNVEDKLTPFMKNIKRIYITGIGAIINNIDLYFSEVFAEKECLILKPYFLDTNASNIKDIIEVNSAIALAMDGLGKENTELDFNVVAKKAANLTPFREFSRDFKLKEKVNFVKEKFGEISKKLNAPPGTYNKKRRGKVKVDFDDGEPVGATITSLGEANVQQPEEETEEIVGFGVLDLWLGRVAALTLSATIVYAGLAIYSNKLIDEKTKSVLAETEKVDTAIASAKSDASYLDGLSSNYEEITNKLATILAKINKQTKKTYDIPNFLSKLMFIMPANVTVKTIEIKDTGVVTINAESGQYAQLGYLVSKIKLEGALQNVEMNVQSVDSNIKIQIEGELPR